MKKTYTKERIYFSLIIILMAGIVEAFGDTPIADFNQDAVAEGYELECLYKLQPNPYSTKGYNLLLTFDSEEFFQCLPTVTLPFKLDSYTQPFDPAKIEEGVEYDCEYKIEQPNQYGLSEQNTILTLNSSQNYECPLRLLLHFTNFERATLPSKAEATTTLKTWRLIEKDKAETYNIKNEKIAISAIEFSVKDAIAIAEMAVSSLESPPASTKPLPSSKLVYQYLDINKKNIDDADIEEAIIRFHIKKEWLAANQ